MDTAMISRRSFLKGTGMAVTLAACSGLFTGCGGSSSSPYAVEIGAIGIDLDSKNALRAGSDVSSGSSGENSWYAMSTVNFSLNTKNGNGIKKTYSELFTATLGDTELTLYSEDVKKKVELTSGVAGYGAVTSAPAQPRFVLTEEQHKTLTSGSVPFTLRVEPYEGQAVIYTMQWNGPITYTKV